MAKIFIFSAPSGCGKSTIIKALQERYPELNLHFGITATSRAPRGTEQNGVEYYFLTDEEFKQKIEAGDFLEYCEVYKGCHYGTLKHVVDSMLAEGKNVAMDLDVIGAQNVKLLRPEVTTTIFIMPPSLQTLRDRLVARGTDSAEVIEKRMQRSQYEIGEAHKFDYTIVNDDLETAINEAYSTLRGEL